MNKRTVLDAARHLGRRLIRVWPTAIAVLAAAAAGSAQAGTSQAGPSPSATARAGQQHVVPADTRAAAGTWKMLPAAPVRARLASIVSVWTGHRMIVHGIFGTFPTRGRVTFAYRPATNSWRRLAPGPAWTAAETADIAVWTWTRMLVFGQTNAEYDPAANTWRTIPGPGGPASTLLGWNGRKVIMWNGTCCGGSANGGSAYDPAARTWHALPPSPLAGRFGASGAWTGKELVVAGGIGNPDGGGPPLFRDGAGYNPVTRTWRTIAPMPLNRHGATGVWDGREVILIGGFRGDEPATRPLAYNPVTNRWRWLPAVPYRSEFAAVWTGRQVLVWGGLTAAGSPPPHGEAYTPAANKWTALPASPLRGRFLPTAVWTGRSMIVWGGFLPDGQAAHDGAAYTPAR